MEFKNYYSPQLSLRKPLLGGTYIPITSQVKLVLSKVNKSTDCKYETGEDPITFLKKGMSDDDYNSLMESGEYLSQFFFAPIENAYLNATLAASQYYNFEDEELKYMDEGFASRKVGNIPFVRFLKTKELMSHMYLNSVIEIQSYLYRLTKDKLPVGLKEWESTFKKNYDKFSDVYPKSRDARNSWQHIDERIRGVKNSNTRTGHLIVLGAHVNNSLIYTAQNGDIAGVDFSTDGIQALHRVVEEILLSIPILERAE